MSEDTVDWRWKNLHFNNFEKVMGGGGCVYLDYSVSSVSSLVLLRLTIDQEPELHNQ